MPQDSLPSLYGITDENSSRHGDNLWGKNQFNSSFPLALCLYMRDQKMSPVSILCDANGQINADDKYWKMADIIGASADNPSYDFESSFKPYETARFSRNKVDTIDLIVNLDTVPTHPLEVKLTVVPDSGTAKQDESAWGPEIVIRPVSSAYAMMGLASSLMREDSHALKLAVIEVLRKGYNEISAWDNVAEIGLNKDSLCKCLRDSLEIALEVQKPFLIQPIWRTQGQSFELCEQCLDVFVWSDVAIMMLPLALLQDNGGVTRHVREVARHVKALYDLLSQGDYDYNAVYKGMALNWQTDKVFSIPGRTARKYLKHDRLQTPLLPASVLSEIICGNGHRRLRPERRFDAAIRDYMIQGEKRQ